MNKLALFALLGLLAIPNLRGSAATSPIVDLGTLGGSESFAGSISDSKLVVGSSRLPGDIALHTFAYRKGLLSDLYPLNSQDIVSAAFPAINNAGWVASGLMLNGIYMPVLYNVRSGRVTVLGSLGGVTPFGFSGVSLGVNDLGQAVGYSQLPDGNRHAFCWSGGLMHDIGSFGGYSAAWAINNSGVIVGFSSSTPFGAAHAFRWEDGRLVDINPFGGSESYALDINEQGAVIGSGLVADESAFHGFVLEHSTVKDLGTLPKGRNTWPTAINHRGQIVGTADAPIGVELVRNPDTGRWEEQLIFGPRAFLYENGAMIDLNSILPAMSGWDLQYANDINANGQILGYGHLAGKFRSFLLTVHP